MVFPLVFGWSRVSTAKKVSVVRSPLSQCFGCREQAFLEDIFGSVPAGNSRLEAIKRPGDPPLFCSSSPDDPGKSAFSLSSESSQPCSLCSLHSLLAVRGKSWEGWVYLILARARCLTISGMFSRGQIHFERPHISCWGYRQSQNSLTTNWGEKAAERSAASLPKGCCDMEGQVFIALNIMLFPQIKTK